MCQQIRLPFRFFPVMMMRESQGEEPLHLCHLPFGSVALPLKGHLEN